MARRNQPTNYSANVRKIADLLKGMTIEELRAVNDVLKDEWTANQQKAARRFVRGDRVWFIAKRGARVTGTVVGVNVKTVSVKADGGEFAPTWRCGAGILNLIEDESTAVSTVKAGEILIQNPIAPKTPASAPKGKKTEEQKKAERRARAAARRARSKES